MRYVGRRENEGYIYMRRGEREAVVREKKEKKELMMMMMMMMMTMMMMVMVIMMTPHKKKEDTQKPRTKSIQSKDSSHSEHTTNSYNIAREQFFGIDSFVKER